MSGERAKTRASFLSPPDFHRLDFACRPVYAAYGSPPYLVGSVLTRPDFRDIDLRLILPDAEFERLVPDEEIGLILNIAFSGLIQRASGLGYQIDFQFQQMTAANEEFGDLAVHSRNPMGTRLERRSRRWAA